MKRIFRKTYKFASFTSATITIFLSIIIGGFLYVSNIFNFWILLGFAFICFFISFVIIQYRVENFIYRRVQKIYNDVSLLDITSLGRQNITTDMKTLTNEIKLFAENKKLEIEAFKIRESYRKDFLGNVSHELKTPLFTVQGYLLTLLEGAIKDKEVREKYLERANIGVERLIFIVKDLDMITKLEVGDLNLNKEEFDIVELVKNVFDLLEMKASDRSIQLTFNKVHSKGILVNADKDRIQQVLTNLIVNSIKYGKKDGTTEVSIDNLIMGKVLIRVTDNGEGIEDEEIPRLFERFYRVDKSGSREQGGSGLGLSIVKHIIDAHNEKIYVESQYGVGSEFSFSLEKVE